ncbi:MAG: threonine/serine exporter family protein [Gemmatimonadota bacterium]
MTNSPERPTRTAWTGWTPVGGLPLPGEPASPDHRISFVLRLGHSLHTSGYAAHRLEEALELASDQLGLRGQFFSTPTSIMASFGPQDDQQTFLIRVDPGDSNLGKLAQADEVTREVLNGVLTPLEGATRLEVIEAAPPTYPTWLNTAAFAVVSGSAARFLGGGWQEVLAGLAIGLVIGLLAIAARRIDSLGRVFEPVAALTASLLAAGMAAAGFPLSVFLATLAGVIVLIPGLMLTTAMTELSTRHLASGTARFMGALVLLLGIAFGIALGTKIATLAFGTIPSAAVRPLPEWTLYLSLLISPLAFVVLLKAEPRDAGWIVLAGALSFTGAHYGQRVLGLELGAFGGALVTGFFSNWYARVTDRPAQITMVPGLLLLVPGSVGLQALASFVDSQTETGVGTAFRMVLIAVSLVAGTLIANIVSPRRKLLT